MQLPRTARLALAAALLMAATVLVNLSPPNPYFAATLKVWGQGHFLNFNGLTRLVSTAWPFAALVYLVTSLRPVCATRSGKICRCRTTSATSFSAATSAKGNERPCCNGKGASAMRDYAKQRVKELGLAGEGKLRVNQAGCLDRCEEGPCIVVYPEAVWYTYVDRADIDEIIEQHLRHGRVVERLRI